MGWKLNGRSLLKIFMKNNSIVKTISFTFLVLLCGFLSDCNSPGLEKVEKRADNSRSSYGDWPSTIAKVQPVSISNTQVMGYLGKRIDRN